ncbi:MAG TPA: site-2 protease family protein [Terriglobales bacterium]|nr:site-2 protease family protein [Terriglobales bacterium]
MPEPSPPPPIFVDVTDPQGSREFIPPPPPRRPMAIHLGLFLLSVFTTLVVGARLQSNFEATQPLFINDEHFFALRWIWQQPSRLLMGLPFAASLLSILLAHEMGHFLYAVKHRVYATLPFFIPAPTPIGTFGAFIQIRSRFRSLAALLDIGVAGPIAGFLVALPLVMIGLVLSKPLPAGSPALMGLGFPPIFHGSYILLNWFGFFGQVEIWQIFLHPVAIGAWIGVLATALNLLPGGQLDGGHIIYAFSPKWHAPVTRYAIAVLVPLSIFYWPGWLIWVFGLWLTRKHPHVSEYPPLDYKRRVTVLVAALLFLLTFTPEPFAGGGFLEMLRQFELLK